MLLMKICSDEEGVRNWRRDTLFSLVTAYSPFFLPFFFFGKSRTEIDLGHIRLLWCGLHACERLGCGSSVKRKRYMGWANLIFVM